MTLTTRDLGLKVEEMTYRREYRLHAVDGLPNGLTGVIFEERGEFVAMLSGVPMDSTARSHASLAAALLDISEQAERFA